MKRLSLLIAAMLCGSVAFGAKSYKADLEHLDSHIAKAQAFQAEKESRIASLEQTLESRSLSLLQVYDILSMLYYEQFPYRFEGTMNILGRMEPVAKEIGSKELMNEVKLNRAETFSTAGMFLEAQDLINNGIDTLQLTPAQKIRFFNIAQRFCGDYREYSANMEVKASFVDRQSYFRSRVFASTDTSDVVYQRVLVQTLLDERNLDIAERICQQALSKFTPRNHEYAVFTYYMGAIAQERNDVPAAIHWFAESASCDICGAVKDNASLYCLALLLLKQDDVKRAFNYTQFALDDALFYNARLRPFQIARSLPAIQSAYEQQQSHNTRLARILLAIISVIAILLLILAVITGRNSRKMAHARKQIEGMGEDLQKAVASLSEANAAKEEYIGLFLSMCSTYLDKLKKHITMKEMDEELRSFYKTFDNAFLNLYPNFVDDFNKLLKPDCQIELKKDELLNTELRIFALIRLGIDQSSHIASLLRYSVNTIYNYRAQIKKAALDSPELFEERVKTL